MGGREERMRLKDKVALVTGSSGGLGTGICRAFAAEGSDCVVNYHSDRAGGQETADLVESLGRKSLLVRADISREDQVQDMVDAALERFGSLDIVVANAGYGMAKPLLETRVEEFEKLVRTNLIGTYLTVRIGAQAMKSQGGGGKIITMSSIHGLGGTHYCSLYEATKAGILNFTRGAAFNLGDYGIQINCIAPGVVPVPKDPPPDGAIGEKGPVRFSKQRSFSQSARSGERRARVFPLHKNPCPRSFPPFLRLPEKWGRSKC